MNHRFTLEDVALDVCWACSEYTEPMFICFDPTQPDACDWGCFNLVSKEEIIESFDTYVNAWATEEWNLILTDTDGIEIVIPMCDLVVHCETPLVLTTDSTPLWVTLSWTNEHTVNIVVTSADADQIGSVGTDGGTLVTCEDVLWCVNIEGAWDITVTGTGTDADPFVVSYTDVDAPVVVTWWANTTVTWTGTAADPYVIDTCCASVISSDWTATVIPWQGSTALNPIFDISVTPSPDLVLTTDGTALWVTQSGAQDHVANIVVTSANEDNILTIDPTDWGTFLDCDTVCECIIKDLTVCEGWSPSDFCEQVAACVTPWAESSYTTTVNANGTTTYVLDNGTWNWWATDTANFCIWALLEDEDGRTENLSCTPCGLHRTIHTTGSLHAGSVWSDCLMVSHADSDQTSLTNITVNHWVTVIWWAQATNTWPWSIVWWLANTSSWWRSFTTWLQNIVTNEDNLTWWAANVVDWNRNVVTWTNNVTTTTWGSNQVSWFRNTVESSFNTVAWNDNLVQSLSNQVAWNLNIVTPDHSSNTVSWTSNRVNWDDNLVVGFDNQVDDINLSWCRNIIWWESNLIEHCSSMVVWARNTLVLWAWGDGWDTALHIVWWQDNTITWWWAWVETNAHILSGRSNTVNANTSSWIISWTNNTMSHINSAVFAADGLTTVRDEQLHIDNLFVNPTLRVFATAAAWFAATLPWEYYHVWAAWAPQQVFRHG